MSAAVVADANTLTTDSPSHDPKTVTRRRTVVVTEKTSNVVPAGDGGGFGNGNDRAGSDRGEALLERTKDLTQMRKTLVQSAVPPRRRKPTLKLDKTEKPKWKTVASVLIKNLLLLVVLFLVGQFVWTLFQKTENGSIVSNGVSNFERKMSELEAFMKTTVKMLQVQVDAVDKKLEGEVGHLRSELRNKGNEKALILERELNKLGARTDNLEMSFLEFKDKGFFSKDDFNAFVGELMSKKGPDGDSASFSLDEIKSHARDIILAEIEKHSADGLGRIDYALASGGARITKHSEPFLHGKTGSWLFGGTIHNGVHGMSKKMLEPSFGEPGQCFPLKGTDGFVEIRLRTAIIAEAITLEHVARSVAYDRSSAPKECRVSGWLQGHETGHLVERPTLVEFTYDLEESNVQIFEVETEAAGPINMVRLDIVSNHGSSSHTCIYRFRVHGHEPNSLPSLPLQLE